MFTALLVDSFWHSGLDERMTGLTRGSRRPGSRLWRSKELNAPRRRRCKVVAEGYLGKILPNIHSRRPGPFFHARIELRHESGVSDVKFIL